MGPLNVLASPRETACTPMGVLRQNLRGLTPVFRQSTSIDLSPLWLKASARPSLRSRCFSRVFRRLVGVIRLFVSPASVKTVAMEAHAAALSGF